MNELPAGRDAVLLDFSAEPDPLAAVRHGVAALRAAQAAGDLDHLEEVVPAASTILVQFQSRSGADILGIHRALRGNPTINATTADEPRLTIPVYYDGADLSSVAQSLGIAPSEVIGLHCDTRWRVQFMGFAPGFGYLVPHDDPENPLVSVERREHPRTTVPSGSVAIAAGYSAIYPRSSPGGWNLLGHTTIQMWDAQSPHPSLLAPGTLVRFVDAARGETSPASTDGHR